MRSERVEVIIDVEIIVKMGPEEYDAYRAYQKEKESIEHRAREDYNAIKKDHKELCDAVLDALEMNDEHLDRVNVKNKEAAEKAMNIAAEWYA